MNSKSLTHFVNYRRGSRGLLMGLAFVSLSLGQVLLGAAQGASFDFTGAMNIAREGPHGNFAGQWKSAGCGRLERHEPLSARALLPKQRHLEPDGLDGSPAASATQ